MGKKKKTIAEAVVDTTIEEAVVAEAVMGSEGVDPLTTGERLANPEPNNGNE